MNDYKIICGILVLCFACQSCNRMDLFYAILLLYTFFKILKPDSNHIRLHLINVDGINESLYVDSFLAGKNAIFMLDTGYAGPPVLSSSYLALDTSIIPDVTFESKVLSIKRRLSQGVSEDEQFRAINRLLSNDECVAYTSGCTMKLMSIGATMEQQADMLMCNMLRLRDTNGFYIAPKWKKKSNADVFVTHALPNSVHILTCDFLMHSTPCIISFQNQTLRMNMSLSEISMTVSFFTRLPFEMSGGAFVVPIWVGGVRMRCTVDTGAPGPISLGSNAIQRINNCKYDPSGRHSLRQTGVNGETICSEIIRADVAFCNYEFESLPIMINNKDVDQVDGYVGLGFLRGFEILILENSIGFQRNMMPVRSFSEYSKFAHNKGCDINLPCS